MFGIQGYLTIGAAIAFAASVAFGAWQYNRANDLQEALAVERVNVQRVVEVNKNLNEQIALIQTIRNQQQKDILSLGDRVNRIEGEKNEAFAKLNDFRNRLGNLAQHKPGLVGRFATRAVGDIMCEFVNTTGGEQDDCKREAVRSSPTSTNSE